MPGGVFLRYLACCRAVVPVGTVWCYGATYTDSSTNTSVLEDHTPLSSRFVYSHTPHRVVAGWLPLRVTPNGQHNISSCSLERPRQHLIPPLGCWRRSTGDLASLSSAKWRSQSIPIERQLMSCCSCEYQRSLCLHFHPEGASRCPRSTSAVYTPPHAQLTNTGRRVSPSPACSSVGLVELPNIKVGTVTFHRPLTPLDSSVQ